MLKTLRTSDRALMVLFTIFVLAVPLIMAPLGAGYPDLMQRFAIYGIFAIGFNILFGLTGYLSLRIFRSPFGMILRAVKSNQTRLNYTGFNSRPYTLTAFVISGMYAGLAGALLVCMDPLAGADRMQWTALGEVVLMTIMGGRDVDWIGAWGRHHQVF